MSSVPDEPTAGAGDEVRFSLAAYVLGALEPDERDVVDAHVMDCPDCAAELDRLTGLPLLLDLVSAGEVAAMGTGTSVAAGPDDGLVQRTVAAALAERRRARRVRRLASVAAGAVLLGGGTALGATVLGHSGGSPGGQELRASDPGTHVSAVLWARPAEWGTELTLRLTGVAPGEECQLVAVGKDGARSVAASWWATYQGKADVTGATGLPEPDTVAYDIVTDDGSRLLRVPTGVGSGPTAS